MRTLVKGHVHLVDVHGFAVSCSFFALSFPFTTRCVEHAVKLHLKILRELCNEGNVFLAEVHCDLAYIWLEIRPHNVFSRVLLCKRMVTPVLFEQDAIILCYCHTCF